MIQTATTSDAARATQTEFRFISIIFSPTPFPFGELILYLQRFIRKDNSLSNLEANGGYSSVG